MALRNLQAQMRKGASPAMGSKQDSALQEYATRGQLQDNDGPPRAGRQNRPMAQSLHKSSFMLKRSCLSEIQLKRPLPQPTLVGLRHPHQK